MARSFAQPPEQRLYIPLLLRTFEISLTVAVICLLLGYPTAYVLTRLSPFMAGLLMICRLAAVLDFASGADDGLDHHPAGEWADKRLAAIRRRHPAAAGTDLQPLRNARGDVACAPALHDPSALQRDEVDPREPYARRAIAGRKPAHCLPAGIPAADHARHRCWAHVRFHSGAWLLHHAGAGRRARATR